MPLEISPEQKKQCVKIYQWTILTNGNPILELEVPRTFGEKKNISFPKEV